MQANTAFIPTMQTVRLSKSDLVKTLLVNRDVHQEAYDKAIVGFFKAKIADLSSGLATTKRGEEWQADGGIVRPSNHSGDYSWAIALLQQSLDNEVHLSQPEFRQFVMDEWTWQTGFQASATSYARNWYAK